MSDADHAREDDDEEQGPRPQPLLRLDEALGAAAMALICLISFANVIVRYATDTSFAFTEEYSVFLLVFMTFIGAAAAFAKNGHLRLTFFRDRLPRTLRGVCDALAILSSLVMFALLIWHGGTLAWDNYRFEETSPGLGNPVWIYTVWAPILSVWIVLRLLLFARDRWRGRRG
ncbi:MAG: TRAP transporter small permease [Pseudomonadota bacterium]